MKGHQLEVEVSQIKNSSYSSELKKKLLPMLKYVSQHHKNNVKNSVGTKTSPCLTLISIRISSENIPLITNQAYIPWCNCLSIFTSISGHLFFKYSPKCILVNCIKSFSQIDKNLILKNLMLITVPLHLADQKIMSVVPLPDLKPLYDFGMTAEQMFQNNRFSKTEKSTLPTASKRVIP